MAYLHVYKGSVTAGGVNGTLASEGDSSSPVTIGPLNASANEISTAQKLAIRCDTGYATGAATTITPTGTTAVKWQLAPDNGSGSPGTWGAYGAAISIPAGINATNTLFWARAKATNDESPSNDTSVDLVVSCDTIVAS